jgi:hypothetical protein
MSVIDYKDPIITKRRKGDSTDPYIAKSESHQVENSTVVLSEIPSELERVLVVGEGIAWLEKNEGIPSENEYVVNYIEGIIHFHESRNGILLQFEYYGTGLHYIPSSRVYSIANNGNVSETLKDIITNGENAIEQLKQVNQTIANAESATTNAQEIADQTKYIELFNINTPYKRNNIVSYNGTSFIAKQDSIGSTPTGYTDDLYWGLISKKGEDGVGSVSIKTETFTATEWQRVFSLPFRYEPLSNKIRVVVGGVQQVKGNFEETNDTTITLNEGVSAGTLVIVEVFSTEFDDRIAEFDLKMSDMNTAISNANASTENANTSATNATTASQKAETAATDASSAANNAQSIADNTNHKGEYSSLVTYYPNNFVRYNDSTYMCILESTGNLPTNSLYFELVALKGVDGTGAVSTVNSLSPDVNGNVQLSANEVGAIPSTEKGVINGVATLDSNSKIPLSQLPDSSKQQTYVVLDYIERNALTNLISGDKCYETSSGDSYIWDNTQWLLIADADWANVNLDWANVINKPLIPTKTSELTNDSSFATTQNVSDVDNKIGFLSGLNTTEKTNIVGATNEVKGSVDSHKSSYLLHSGYAATTGTANNYIATLNPTLSTYAEGVSLRLKINIDNTSISTVDVNGLGAVPIKKPNGNDVAAGNLKAGSIYTIVYNGTNFILQGEGGEDVDPTDLIISANNIFNM